MKLQVTASWYEKEYFEGIENGEMLLILQNKPAADSTHNMDFNKKHINNLSFPILIIFGLLKPCRYFCKES